MWGKEKTGTGRRQKTEQEEDLKAKQEKNPKIKKVVRDVVGVTAATATSAVLISKAYEIGSKKENDTYKCFLQKEMLNQAYEVLSNIDIDMKIKKKTEEIESLRQKLDRIKEELPKKRKKKREDQYNCICAQIRNKSDCLDYLKQQKEKQESISKSLSKRTELADERINTSFLRLKRKNELSIELTTCEADMKRDLDEYKELEEKIVETEKAEKELAGEHKVIPRKGIGIRIFKITIAIMCICLICGIIAFLCWRDFCGIDLLVWPSKWVSN